MSKFIKRLKQVFKSAEEAFKAGFEEGTEVRKLKHEQKIEAAKMHGQVLKATEEFKQAEAASCTHRKGGLANMKTGQIGPGTDNNYAVIKHKFQWGDTWVYCQRCPKRWRPGDEGYEEALNFPTNNVTSTSGNDWVEMDQKRIKDKARQFLGS